MSWTGSGFPRGGEKNLAFFSASRLADIWGAHYWQRHGPDRLAAVAFTACSPCLGFTAKIEPIGAKADIYQWIATGKAEFAVGIKDLTFLPANKSAAERQKDFEHAMILRSHERKSYRMAAESAAFAVETGRVELWDAVTLNRDFQYHGQHSSQARQFFKDKQDAEWQANFSKFLAVPNQDSSAQWNMQQKLHDRPDEDLLAFAARYLVTDLRLIDRLCAGWRQDSYACTNARNKHAAALVPMFAAAAAADQKAAAERAAMAEAQAIRDEQERQRWLAMNKDKKPGFWDQLASLAEAFDAALSQGNQMVTVRQYDSAGNFTGTSEMTRTQAIGMGAISD